MTSELLFPVTQTGPDEWATRNLRYVGGDLAWAVTSPDDRYRYLLGRSWNARLPRWLVCMLNPSTARVEDDHTIAKLKGFVSRAGGGGFVVINTMAYSETHPGDLVAAYKAGADVVGPRNVAAVFMAVEMTAAAVGRPAGETLVAWGNVPKALATPASLTREVLLAQRERPLCLGQNADGSPKHPLRLAYATPLVPYRKDVVA